MAQRVQRHSPNPVVPTVVDVVACSFDEREEDPVLARQRVAGEEDQSVPGWDQGA